MNRKQRVKMIVRVLLMPFTRPPFEKRDLLLESARAYRDLLHSEDMYLGPKWKACEKAHEALVRCIEEETRPDKLSELGELLEMFYPESRLADYLGQSEDMGLDGYYIKTLLRLAAEFITLRDGKVSIKMWDTPDSREEFFPNSSGLYKVELWSEISRVITPDILIAGYFVQCGIDDPRYLRRLPDNIFLSDSLLARLNEKGMAETHLHLSAGMSYLSVWEAVTDPAALRMTPTKNMSFYQRHQRQEQRRYRSLLLAGWLRLIMAKYLEETQGAGKAADQGGWRSGDIPPDLPDAYFRDQEKMKRNSLEVGMLRHILGDQSETGDLEELLDMLEGKHEKYLAILDADYGVDRQADALDVLMRGPYAKYRYLGTSSELLLLFFALRHIRDFPKHSGFQQVFLCYLRIKNNYFSNKLQSTGTSGLTFFQRYFSSAASAIYNRKGEDRQKIQLAYRAAFRNQLHCTDMKKLEVKVSPPPVMRDGGESNAEYSLSIANQLSEIFGAYKNILEELGAQGEDRGAPTLGIVYHLIRSNIQRAPASMCWALDTAAGPGDIVSHLRHRCEGFVSALQYLLRTVPNLSEYVVGLDVASEEIYTEPWVYAPVYHKARNRMSTYPIQLDSGKAMQNIGLTYHVGEDYHHVLSGLRHIDEVLTYFGYKAGDRLGHGLALQIDMAEWMHNNEVVSLPVMEHLENLLWLWSLCSKDIAQLVGYLPELEREIMRLAEKIYGNIKGITPYVLWNTYVRKFERLEAPFCERMEKMYLHGLDNGAGRAVQMQPETQRSFCARAWQTSDQAECTLPYVDSVWDSDKLLLTHYCPIYARHYRAPYFTSNGAEKISVYAAVQAHMRHKVQNMGVFVETNPTSNLIIGDIPGLRDYPITTLNSRLLSEKASSSVLISINSDDPLLFNTNVENELALVYHTLVYQNISREEVLAWIDKVRQYGVDSSFIREVKSIAVQKRELGEMIEQLGRLRDDMIGGAGM